MKALKSAWSAVLFVSFCGASLALPVEEPDEAGYATTTLDQRVARLEKKASAQSLTEVLREVDRLKEELRRLRGELEEFRNAIERDRQADQEQRTMLLERVANVEGRNGLAAPVTGKEGVPPEAPVSSGESPAPEGISAVDRALSGPKAAASPKEDPQLRQKAYEQAFELLKQAHYTDAVAEFQAFVAKYPAGDHSDNAQYWLGEALYMNRSFVAAREAFKKLVTDFPQSSKVADAKLKLAFIEYENQQYPKAREWLGEVIKNYPETTAAKMAEKRLERMRQENR